MDLLPTPEQEEIVASVSSFLAKEVSIDEVREAMEGEVVDRSVWQRYGELGLFGLGLEADLGGVGYTLAEEALVFREVGRHLTPGPLLSTVLGARAAAGAGDEALLGRVLSGEVIIGWAEPRPGASIGRTVDGSVVLIDALDAELTLVVGEDGAALIPRAALDGATAAPCVDTTARLAFAELHGVEAVAHVAADRDPIARRGAVLSAAALVGIAEATRDMSVEYAKNRVQFGKPIGVNQAIKHRCSDMAARCEAALSQMLFAALVVRDRRPEAAFQASTAKFIASDAAVKNAAANVQNHGGMGFTWEHDAHLYVTRAHLLDQQVGSRRLHLRRLLDEPAAQR